MGVSRPSRAVELVCKWDCKIEKKAIGTDYEESSRNEPDHHESGLDMLSFSDESRNG